MPKVTYDSARGLIQEAGSGIQLSTFPYTSTTTTVTTAQNNTGSLPGLYVLNAGATATFKMPLASEYPGGTFIFRNGSDGGYANVLTGSGEANGTKVFVLGDPVAASAKNGSSLALQAVVGASVALVSDGVNYIVMPGSGSLAFSGA